MKAEKVKKIIIRAVLTVSVSGALFLGSLWNFAAPISAATEAPSPLTEVTGDFFPGLSADIRDPVRVTNADGYYYKPSAYVYFGAMYDSATEQYQPILCRVLDADADNTGKSGAMFVLTEQAIRANDKFSSQHVSSNDYFDFENIYTDSVIHKFAYAKSLFEGIDLIRPITKTDVLANMEGAFGYTDGYGYKWETDVYDTVNFEAIPATEATLLQDSKLFPLSAEELLRYVSNYNSAPGMSASHALTKASVTWWLRTGFNDAYGNLVGAVDESGKVVPVSADSQNVAGRYAFNIETEDVSYTHHLGNNVYKLAFHAPEYQNTETPFHAEVADVKNGAVTVKYTGYIPNAYYDDGSTAYISVMIQNSAGEVTYYGSIAEVPAASDSTAVATDSRTAAFPLPEGYSEGDTVTVFWERKFDNGESISYTGNMVELDCIHTEGTAATCTTPAVCGSCHEAYGSPDRENHTNVEDTLYYDDETDTHWNLCADCGEPTNTAPCEFGPICTAHCACGNIDVAYHMHTFNERGVCIYDKTHFESPLRIDMGSMSNFEIHNEGQFISLAKYVNAMAERGLYNEYGTYWGYPNIVTLKADLDFTGIDNFVPMGTENSPFNALVFEGMGHTVKGIELVSEEAYVGLFGVVKDTAIEHITVKDCSFVGSQGASALVGKAINVDVRYVTVDNVLLHATDGHTGSVMAISDEDSEILYSISYGVLDREDLNLPFTSDNRAVIGNSYCLAEETDITNGKMTLSQFESGEVGYLFSQLHSSFHGSYGGQQIGVDPYPYFGGMRVYMAETCEGEAVYFNDINLKGQIEAHNYTAFAEEEPTFIWEPKMGTETYNCFVSAVCGDCGHIGLAEADVVMDYSRIPVRADWTATITLGGQTKTESKTSIGILIQDSIGMTGIVKDFDGVEVWPEELMTNHRLQTSPPAAKEYEVFFVNSETGEKLCYTYTDSQMGLWVTVTEPISVMAAGTYDLLVIGKNDYEGQEYTYKGALVINPVTLTVSPLDVYKHYDGNNQFVADYVLDNETVGEEWFDVILDQASGANVGDYRVGVSIRYNTHAYKYEDFRSSITVTLDRDTVTAAILPLLYPTVENKNYPTKFTYGDSIPTPTADHFTVSGNGDLTFRWYQVQYENYSDKPVRMTAIDGLPTNAGNYILRVNVASTENTLATYADFEITVEKQMLNLELSVPEGTESVKIGYIDYHMVDSLDDVTVTFIDSNGNPVAIDGLTAYPQLTRWEIDSERERYCYHVEYNAILASTGVTPENYHVYRDSICLSLPADEESFIREITMWVKEGSIDLSSPHIEFDIRNVVMQAGEVFLLGHTLTDVKLAIDRDSGEIRVAEFTVLNAGGYDVSHLYRLMTDVENWSHTEGGHNVVHIFDHPCDTDCNVRGCTFTRTTHHVGGTPTCVSPAVCESCGELYGEINVENHVESGTVIMPNPDDFMTHLHLHTCCGAVAEVAEHTEGTPATCTHRAVCSVCGWSYGELNPTNHSSDACTYVADANDPSAHLKTHVCCGAVEQESHSGGVATCVALASCDLCKAPYGALNPHNHAALPTASPDESDASLHRVSYSCCHTTLAEAHTGGLATCTTAAVCTLCGASYGETDPHNHASDQITHLVRKDNASMHDLYHSCCQAYIGKAYHSGGVATCASAALCELCGEPYGHTDPSHHAGDVFAYAQDPANPGQHVKSYACCGEKVANEDHSGGEATCLHGPLCAYCGADYGEAIAHVYDNGCDAVCNVCGQLTRALSFHGDTDGNGRCDVCDLELPKEGLSGGAISAIATTSTVAVGAGSFSLIWFVIKKKKWIDLIGRAVP